MKGMVPPMPMYMAGLPKKLWEAACMAVCTQGAKVGAFQPVWGVSSSNRTRAP